MQTIFDGTTGGSNVASSSGSGSMRLPSASGNFVHGSSSGGGKSCSIQSVPLRSAISPYCGPKSERKRQYFMVSSLWQCFFYLLRAGTLVMIQVDGAHRIGIPRARFRGRIAKCRCRHGLLRRDARRGSTRSGFAAVHEVSGKIILGIRRPGEIDDMLIRTGDGDQSCRNGGWKQVAVIERKGIAGIAEDFDAVGPQREGGSALRCVAIDLVEGGVFVEGMSGITLPGIRYFKGLNSRHLRPLTHGGGAGLRGRAGFGNQRPLDADEGTGVLHRLPSKQDSIRT